MGDPQWNSWQVSKDDAPLDRAEVVAMDLPKRLAVAAEDVRRLQRGAMTPA
jgi:hypothetical protein